MLGSATCVIDRSRASSRIDALSTPRTRAGRCTAGSVRSTPPIVSAPAARRKQPLVGARQPACVVGTKPHEQRAARGRTRNSDVHERYDARNAGHRPRQATRARRARRPRAPAAARSGSASRPAASATPTRSRSRAACRASSTRACPATRSPGVIEAVGEDIDPWEVGQRVGVGWFGGNCGYCDPCRRGDMISCVNGQVPGIAYDGGYADHVVVPQGRARLDPRRPVGRGRRAAAVRRHHHLQRAARERRAPGRPRRRSSASAASATSASSSPGGWASRPSRSPAARTRSEQARSRSAPTTTSTPPAPTSPKRCRSSAARRRSSPP